MTTHPTPTHVAHKRQNNKDTENEQRQTPPLTQKPHPSRDRRSRHLQNGRRPWNGTTRFSPDGLPPHLKSKRPDNDRPQLNLPITIGHGRGLVPHPPGPITTGLLCMQKTGSTDGRGRDPPRPKQGPRPCLTPPCRPVGRSIGQSQATLYPWLALFPPPPS